MASVTTSGTVDKQVRGAYAPLVRVGDAILSLADYQKQYDAADAGSKPEIAATIRNAHLDVVDTDVGRKTLPEYVKTLREATEAPTIIRITVGGHSAKVVTAEAPAQPANLAVLYEAEV